LETRKKVRHVKNRAKHVRVRVQIRCLLLLPHWWHSVAKILKKRAEICRFVSRHENALGAKSRSEKRFERWKFEFAELFLRGFDSGRPQSPKPTHENIVEVPDNDRHRFAVRGGPGVCGYR